MSTPSKKKRCQNWKLYVITDPSAGKNLLAVVRSAIAGGANVVQLRDKKASRAELVAKAKELLKVTRELGVPLILNDDAQAAKEAGCDGVHLGQDDGPLTAAREILGENAIIGRSTHSPEQALAAEQEGFDYIGVGPIFGTPTKPTYAPVGLDLVRFAATRIKIPFVAIGGIDVSNVSEVRAAGAQTVAVVRAIMAAPNPAQVAQRLSCY
jgi:thiamine-phosphate pyrophosphorylase